MGNLAEQWSKSPKVRQMSMPTSIRLRPSVDADIQRLLFEFPHLTQTQIINDLLIDAISRLNISQG